MKLYKFLEVACLSGFLLLSSCSRKKDTFVSRNFHAVTTEFNTLYNGNLAFVDGVSGLEDTYEDNYWEVLPVERLQLSEEITLSDDSKDPNFERAEEKAVKAIRNHTMQIDGKEYNPQIDESFMLLGKARYYDNRLIPALDAFNYILAFYPTSNNIAQAKIWKAKTNMRLDNNEVAIDNLRKIFKVEQNLKEQDQADAYAMLAQAFLNIGHQDTALIYIKDAALLTKKNEERGRYNYIKGQLYNKLGYKDSANAAFAQVIDLNRKIPRKYLINAYLEKVRNLDYDNQNPEDILALLNDLEGNRENRPFLDRIYYTKADFYMNTGKEDSAILNYNKSLRAQSADKVLVSKDYLALAEFNFGNAKYQDAGAYYDSTLTQLSEKDRLFRKIKKKRDNLNEVITYENLSQRNDSILSLVLLSEVEQRAYFENIIAERRAKAVADSLKAVTIKNDEFFTASTENKKQSGPFYFYNPTAVAYGKQAFEKQWGNRKLEDVWRLSAKPGTLVYSDGLAPALDPNTTTAVPELTVEEYLASIPKEQTALDSIARERNDAYYQLGLIYKEKFKENTLAASRLERLLTLNPEDRLVLPSKYYLYQIYNTDEVNGARALAQKDEILNNYPDSRYASILRNPTQAVSQDVRSPESLYNVAYRDYRDQNYDGLLDRLDGHIDQFYGDDYLPKFELLKATTIGKLQGYEAYRKALNFIALTYPNAEEGKRAQDLLKNTVPQMAFVNFDSDADAKRFKILYPYAIADYTDAAILQQEIDSTLARLNYSQYTTSVDRYTEDMYFVVVHHFTSAMGAQGIQEVLEKELNVPEESIVISSSNYSKVQIHKNITQYQEQLN